MTNFHKRFIALADELWEQHLNILTDILPNLNESEKKPLYFKN